MSVSLRTECERKEITKGSSKKDVTAFRGRGCQGFCDNSTKASVIKSVTMGGGDQKMFKIA